MSPINPICSHCGKPLHNQACFACEGNGYSNKFLLVHKECDVCHGSGQIWRCEDEFKHIVDDFKNTHKVEHSSVTQVHHKEVVPTFSHTPSTTRQIPTVWPMHPESPWNPNHDGLGLPKATKPKITTSSGHPHNRNNPINRTPVKK